MEPSMKGKTATMQWVIWGAVPVARLVIRTAKFKLRSDSGQPCFEPLALQAGFQVAGQGKRSCNQSGHVARPMPLLCRKVAGLGFDVVNWQSYPAAVEFLMTCVHQRKSFGILRPWKSCKHAPPPHHQCLHVFACFIAKVDLSAALRRERCVKCVHQNMQETYFILCKTFAWI